jgi:ubiquitin C-terminal hydrolase
VGPKPEIEIYKLKSYMRVLNSLNCFFKNNKRRNVNEVLIFILDALHNELRGDNNESIISKTVTFSLRNEINCNFNCGCSSCRTTTFNTFDLDISKTYQFYQKDINIYDCLNYWKSNYYPKLYCYNCRDFTPRAKISKIEYTPKVFIFLLERGNDFDQKNKNIKINFIINKEIDLSSYIDEGLSNSYELTGIVSIYAANKKYICYCKSPIDSQWYYFNDTDVNCISLDDIINHSYNQRDIPCILYYTKIEKKTS